jgi:tetratricopeptide (TPR) repeat protein
MEIVLNKKSYPDNGIFTEKKNGQFCNLKIYPLVATLEKHAGLISDMAEAFNEEQIGINYLIYGNGENYQFLEDNIRYSSTEYNQYINLVYILEDYDCNYDKIKQAKILICKENSFFDYFEYKIQLGTFCIYMYSKYYNVFMKHFWYYFQDDVFCYDNLICYAMIVKNAGPEFEQILLNNLQYIDRWCIVDTGSTDGTQEIIKRVLKNKKGKLYEQPFVNFKVSRNNCLDFAGTTCKFTMMLDDTYQLRGNIRTFLNEVRGDQFSDSFSLLIQSDDNEYYSNRIIKSNTFLRYKYTIHEVITDENNINVTIPKECAWVFDVRSDYMEKRTNDRKYLDLQMLFDELNETPDDPRSLYYIAQTYGCLKDYVNQAKYFELRLAHPVQGYIQEKIDTFFELARIYNFKIHRGTNKDITDGIGMVPEEEWEVCKKLYLEAYNLDTNRPDSLYFIGIHYYLIGDYQQAYIYFKKGFEIGYPINSQYSLKPTLSFHFLPKFLTEVCYYVEDHELGKKSAELYLTNNPSTNLISNWYNIHSEIVKMGKMITIKQTDKTFVIVADGGWTNWNGNTLETEGLGGSETWVIETARNIKSINASFLVIVFCKTNEIDYHCGVEYRPISSFNKFVVNNVVDYCIISRYTQYIPVALKGNCKNVGVIFHDLLIPETIIPNHPKLKWIFGLTDWHGEQIKKMFPCFKEIVHTTNYGIEKFEISSKIKNSFIYSSFPNRGLSVLLKLWPRILELLPDATLNVYCDLNHEWTNKVAPDEISFIKQNINKPGIVNHGWVSKKELYDAWSKTEYWLYPCIFEETFCLTAYEAAISKTFVITNNLAGLSETVGNRGLIIEGDPTTTMWQDTFIERFKGLNETFKNQMILKNYNFVRSWKEQTEKLMKHITLE